VYFQPDKIGHGKLLPEERANIVEVGENALGCFVAFAAENFVAVNTEIVENIPLFGGSFFDEARERSFDRVELSGMRFERRMDTDEI